MVTTHREKLSSFRSIKKKWDKYKDRPIFWLINRIFVEVIRTYQDEMDRMEEVMDQIETRLTKDLSKHLFA